ncbi:MULTISPECIES: tRNA preQ1(34) S-adenosylmethionine ribosyltransferase-isomerase QueA [unclassified Prochlorococcus]|uniref:tRNA preQ1(34) S-adenosylmethionine ribosyltransferase-isomerase QueA n=1 Tax=unclassified Prochlorococcus TaxID=2627481 RepID=UPI000533837D|nr:MULTISPECIES: tRNA preQ1(34) S-adenosylmethionine ribosyltransferase-isomerase QueA [unclassified Prochlorococcus]KGG16559.1 S-adenosylmethionine:tRNA ribosyltransferase-isomerase [Prochlorococcus sp. MIT 0602]KGG16966.1 S-adenosylmethionine:tRNA ribosyltransferase-isomerase [Prochlorococcus sp. MIT 0603]
MLIDPKDFLLSSYNYELDTNLIAQEPIEPRHNARMMVVPKSNALLAKSLDLKVWDLLNQLNPGDLLVMNDTRVLQARLRVRLKNGSLAELLLIEPQEDGRWLCLGKPAKKMNPGDCLLLEASEQSSLSLRILNRDKTTGGRIVQFPASFGNRETMEDLLKKYGEMPLPPYIHRYDLSNIERYQTRYASKPGAVAAPTAGLHLSDQLLDALRRKGVFMANVTLHVGLGTFRPLQEENLNDLSLHSEWVEVKEEVVSAINECRCRRGRVIAVGTTTVRSLEAAFLAGQGSLQPFKGSTDLVIKPGYKFGIIDGLLTNFHLPKSSLLLMVSALIGRENLLTLYKQAREKKYRFFSYGDAMLIRP